MIAGCSNPFADIPASPTVPTPDNTPQVTPTPSITWSGIRPNRSPITGGIEVVFLGSDLDSIVAIRFGTIETREINHVDDQHLRVMVPATNTPGIVDVTLVANPANTHTALPGPIGFEYFLPLKLTNINPNATYCDAGAEISIQGDGLTDRSQVSIDNIRVAVADQPDLQTINVILPELSAGPHTVQVQNINGSDILVDALLCKTHLNITQLDPNRIMIGEETRVIMTGTGFTRDMRIALYDTVFEINGVSLDGTRAEFTIGAQQRPEGPYDLYVQTHDEQRVISNALLFIDPNQQGTRIIAHTPQAGVTHGGTEVHFFLAGDTTLTDATATFDDLPSPCSTPRPHELVCVTPAHAAGNVNVGIELGSTWLQSPQTFTYVELSIDHLSTQTGSMAGGTWVRMFGSGFEQGLAVTLNGKPVRDLRIESSTRATFLSPENNIGPATLALTHRNATITQNNAFTYFDPYDATYATWGGSIAGSINITVLDTGGVRLKNATVVARAMGQPDRIGITNAQGQVTLSHEFLNGPVDVHTAFAGHAGFSWIGLASRNASMTLTKFPPPQQDPLPECPAPQSHFPALIRGNIVRIKDEFNTGRDVVSVTTTAPELGVDNPPPGAKAVVLQQGAYEILSRTGPLVLIATAREPKNSTLVAHALGFRGFVNVPESSGTMCHSDGDCDAGEVCWGEEFTLCLAVLEGIDIVIDTPMDGSLRVDLSNAPLDSNATSTMPNTARVDVWYDMQPLGVWSLHASPSQEAHMLTLPMPRTMPSNLQSFYYNVQATVGRTAMMMLPEGVRNFGSFSNSNQQIDEATFTHIPTTLFAYGSEHGDLTFTHGSFTHQVHTLAPTAHVHILYDIEVVQACKTAPPMGRAKIRWYVFASPNTATFNIPAFPASSGNITLEQGVHYWQATTLHTPDVSFETLVINALFDSLSRGLNATEFTVSAPDSTPL